MSIEIQILTAPIKIFIHYKNCIANDGKTKSPHLNLCRFSCKSNIVHLILIFSHCFCSPKYFLLFSFYRFSWLKHFLTHNLFAIPIIISRVISLFSTNLRFSRSKEDETCFIILYCLLFLSIFHSCVDFLKYLQQQQQQVSVCVRHTKKIIVFWIQC